MQDDRVGDIAVVVTHRNAEKEKERETKQKEETVIFWCGLVMRKKTRRLSSLLRISFQNNTKNNNNEHTP